MFIKVELCMLKKLISIALICAISFGAGIYYTLNTSSTKFLDWNKNSVELFAAAPATLSSVYDDVKLVLSTSMNFIDNQLDNLFHEDKEKETKLIKYIEKNHDNPIKPVDDSQKIDVDNEEIDPMPADGGMGI